MILLVPLLAVACGDEVDDRCMTNSNASFELGTGTQAFEPLTDGQDLRMSAGLQGGCHFWVSVQTNGFAARGLVIAYDVLNTSSGQSTGSAASGEVLLQPRSDAPGQCEYVGFAAALSEPWTFEDQLVRLDVTLTDDDGRTGTVSKTVVARWPESGFGGERPDWCGFRG